MVKGLIFDLDGVIVSTELNHYLAWKKIADKFDIPFNEEANEELKGLSRKDSLIKLLEISNLSFEETYFNELLTIKNEHYLNSLESLSMKNVLPGVLMLLDNAKKILDNKNFKISRSLVGNYCTSLEMQGASITLTKLDEEIAKHWDSKVQTAAMRWGM